MSVISRCLCQRAPLVVARGLATPAKKNKKLAGIHVLEAIRQIQETAPANFIETLEIAIRLGVDPKKPGQNIRGFASLPHGTGKVQRIAVFASKPEDVEAAKAAGAELVGVDEIIEEVLKGNINFDRCVATPDSVGRIAKIARVLGPRGLMPNPKLGTVTTNVAAKVKEMKAGQVQFRADKTGTIHAGVAKLDFPVEDIADNVRSFMTTIADAKPEDFKGTYFKAVHMSSTMGKGFRLSLATIDPSSTFFMVDLNEDGTLRESE